ncbi:glycyl-radical enzyme activating protein [Spirochaetia bacterium]|nr:glycyl-radical enzyme activating protein [Spirochaetia bacterium]
MIEPVTDNRALVFDVQSFSIHDGPGIRTTVFFKGCPLNCMWCHNPESKKAKPELVYHQNLCVGCLLCVGVCESGAQLVLPDGTHAVNHGACTGCGKCIEVCCYGALDISGKTYSPEELCEKISGDKRYFNLEGGKNGERGGITFSGGEPLRYAGFIANFCALIPGVHTAMETSGYGSREDFEKIIDCIDIFLFDIKMINAVEHKKRCGVDNELIFRNLEFLYASKKKIVLRLPLIQGINDTEEQFDGVAELLRKYPEIERAEILPYHNFGIAKAESLGIEVSPELPRLNAGKETIEKWLGASRERGCANVYCA